MARGFCRGRLKYSVNETFFNNWTSQVAYVLGFTYADGNIHKTSLCWDLQKRDKSFLEKINTVFESTYPIREHRGRSCRLRITNQLFIDSAVKKGLIPKKSHRLIFPEVPELLLRHFVRGYLDGDGWVVLRNGRNEVDLGFVCGNKTFIENLSKTIFSQTGILGRVRKKQKITPKGYKSTTFLMEYYSSNAIKVANWLYSNLEDDDLFLSRKYKKYLQAVKLYKYLNSGTRVTRVIQKNMGRTLGQLLSKLYVDEGLNGVQVAEVLNVHSSSIYRWLAKTGIRYPEHRAVHEQ